MTNKKSQEKVKTKSNGKELSLQKRNLQKISKREKPRAPSVSKIGKTSDERSDRA